MYDIKRFYEGNFEYLFLSLHEFKKNVYDQQPLKKKE